MAQFNIQGNEGTKKKKKKKQDNPTVTTVPTKKTELPIIKKVEDKKTPTIVPTEETITAVVEPEKTLLSSTEVAAPKAETLEDAINRIRREKEVQNALKREQTIAQGTTSLQGSLNRTNQAIGQQEDSLDPRYGSAKASAVAGTRVSQNRLANILPFSGQQSGRGLRQAQGIESDLQNRQSQLDTMRGDEEQNIALRRQQATEDYNQGVQSLQQGASLAETNSNIRASELADTRLLNETVRQEGITEKANETAFNQELQNIGQYSNDFMAEINRRTATNPNDPLIPFLRNARQQKIADIAQSEADAASKQREIELERENTLLDAEIEMAIDTNQNQLARQLENLRTSNDIAIENIKQSGRRELDNGTSGTSTSTSGPSLSVVKSGINNFVAQAKENSTSPSFGPNATKQAIMLWMYNNEEALADDQVYEDVLLTYNLTEDELKEHFAKLQQFPPSAGL